VTVHQLVRSMPSGVASTNDVLALQAQFGGPTQSLISVGAPLEHAGLAMFCRSWSQLLSVAGPADTLLVHCGVPGPSLPSLRDWRGRVLLRLHDPGLLPGEELLLERATGCVATSDVAAHGVGAHWTGGAISTVFPLLPLDGFAACQHTAPANPVVLFDAPMHSACATPSALLITHLLRAHILGGTELVRLGPVLDAARADAMTHLSAQFRLTVHWLGVVAHPAVLHAYASSSVLLADSSVFPAAAVFAMAAGLPVVGRETPLLAEIVGDAGLLVGPLDDETVLAEAVAEIVGSAQLAEQLRERGRRRVERFAPSRSAGQMHSLLTS
jgi:hypothetical protein